MFTVTNVGKQALTLLELAPTFTFTGPGGNQAAFGGSILLIPTAILPGESWTHELSLTDEMLPRQG